MVQLSIMKNRTPRSLTITLDQEASNPDSPMNMQAKITAEDGSELARAHCTLKGVEIDLVEDLVQSAVQTFQWAAPSNLGPCWAYFKRRAVEHRQKHQAP
jgi:hypothetical protein